MLLDAITLFLSVCLKVFQLFVFQILEQAYILYKYRSKL